jgi:hypothetical protein
MIAYAQSSWYADGLRWIASLISGAADHLDRVAFAPLELEPPHRELPRDALPSEDSLDDIRHRIQNRYY